MNKSLQVLTLFTLIAIIAVLTVACVALWNKAPEIIVTEKVVEVQVEVEKECLVQVCPECIVTRTIETIIEKPCPECRCACTLHGAWADNGTAWWDDNKTTGYTP